jgi:hypothetical protein
VRIEPRLDPHRRASHPSQPVVDAWQDAVDLLTEMGHGDADAVRAKLAES